MLMAAVWKGGLADMASSFELISQDYKGRYIKLTLEQTKNVSENTSTVEWTLEVVGGSSSYYSTGPVYAYVDGEQICYYERKSYSSEKFPAAKGEKTGKTTVSHNTDGSCSVDVSLTSAIYTSTTSTVSGTWTLDTIPRESGFGTITGTTLGGIMRVNINRYSSSFTHKVFYHYGNDIWSGGNSGGTYADVPLDISLAEMSKEASFDLLLLLRTYDSSGTQVGGDVRQYVTVYVPDDEDTKPAVTMKLTSADTPFEGLYLQEISRVKAEIFAEGKYQADIEGYSVSVDGRSYPEPYVSDPLIKAVQLPVTGYAVDSRGFTGSVTETITVLPYTRPKLTGVEAYRCDDKGARAEGGEYLKIIATRDYAPVVADGVQMNFCSIRYRYKAENAQEYTEYVTILEGNAAGNTVITAPMLNAQFRRDTAYTVQISAIDTVGQATVTTIPVPSERVFRHKRAGGKGLGLGGYCEEDDLLDVHWNQRVRKDLRLDGEFLWKEKKLLDLIYPVGSIYISAAEVDPAALFGGTWEQLKDRFLLAAGDTYEAGKTGGAAEHTLTVEEMPKHSHYAYGWAKVEDGSGTYKTLGANEGSDPTYDTYETGGGKAHNNMPPYVAVYMWKRTA